MLLPTKFHRHSSTSIYHVFRGSGTTPINGQAFHWQKGDTFIVPLWSGTNTTTLHRATK
ncbi:MAG: hypothetical protein ACREPG_05680 [Candidatus Binatia bacterium]